MVVGGVKATPITKCSNWGQATCTEVQVLRTVLHIVRYSTAAKNGAIASASDLLL